MTTQVFYQARAKWTSRIPDMNNGSPRPLLQPNRPYLTIHYTGVGWHLSNGALRYPPLITANDMVHIENVADAGKKSFEYNWVIPTGTPGYIDIWEYAGNYQAAHSEGENPIAIGVLLLLGVDNYGKPNQLWQPISDEMIDAIKRLRYDLVQSGMLALDHQIRPHQAMPGANTPCPGVPTINAWPRIISPYPTPTPDPPLPKDDTMILVNVPDEPTVFAVQGNIATWVNGPDAGNQIQREIAAGILAPVSSVPRSWFALRTLFGPEPTSGVTRAKHFAGWVK